MDIQTIARINELRRKAIDGQLTQDDMIEGIQLLRADRRSAAVASETVRKKKAIQAIPDADTLLDELGGL